MRRDWREAAAIFAGGAVGALARTGLSAASASLWITFAVNVAGAFALGYFVTRLQERLPLSAYRRPFLGTGFCGALTTFSTFGADVLRLVDLRRLLAALAYVGATLALGLGAAVLAWSLTA